MTIDLVRYKPKTCYHRAQQCHEEEIRSLRRENISPKTLLIHPGPLQSQTVVKLKFFKK